MDGITVTATNLARRMGKLLNQVRRGRTPLIITWHGRPEAAVVSIDEYRSLIAARERLRQLERDEPLVQQATAQLGVTRREAHLLIAEARQDVYTLIERAHERNPNASPDVLVPLIEEAREAARD